MSKKYFTAGEEGQGLVEYGITISLVAVVCIATVTLLGSIITDNFYQIINDALSGL